MSCTSVIKLRSGTKENIPTQVVNGELIHLVDTDEIYYGNVDEYVPIVLEGEVSTSETNQVGYSHYQYYSTNSNVDVTTRTGIFSPLVVPYADDDVKNRIALGSVSFVGEFEVINLIPAGGTLNLGNIIPLGVVIRGRDRSASSGLSWKTAAVFRQEDGEQIFFQSCSNQGVQVDEDVLPGKYVAIFINSSTTAN